MHTRVYAEGKRLSRAQPNASGMNVPDTIRSGRHSGNPKTTALLVTAEPGQPL